MQYFGFDRPSFGIKTFGFGSSEFSPLDLFAWGNQGAWYDPSDKSTLFQDVAGTVPVTKDGDPVALMRDKSGNGNHAKQTMATARAVYKTDGILHWLAFDGVDDFFQSNAMVAPVFSTTAGAMSSAFVGLGGVAGVVEEVVATTSVNRRVVIYGSKSGATVADGYLSNYAPQGIDGLSSKNTVDGDKRVVTVYSRNNRFYTKINSAAASDLSISANFTEQTRLTIARQTVSNGFFKGMFYGAILVGGVNTDSAIVDIEQYLAAKSGVML